MPLNYINRIYRFNVYCPQKHTGQSIIRARARTHTHTHTHTHSEVCKVLVRIRVLKSSVCLWNLSNNNIRSIELGYLTLSSAYSYKVLYLSPYSDIVNLC